MCEPVTQRKRPAKNTRRQRKRNESQKSVNLKLDVLPNLKHKLNIKLNIKFAKNINSVQEQREHHHLIESTHQELSFEWSHL